MVSTAAAEEIEATGAAVSDRAEAAVATSTIATATTNSSDVDHHEISMTVTGAAVIAAITVISTRTAASPDETGALGAGGTLRAVAVMAGLVKSGRVSRKIFRIRHLVISYFGSQCRFEVIMCAFFF